MKRVLLTGATGFVGGRVLPALRSAGWDVVCASRKPHRGDGWVVYDAEREETLAPALQGVDAVVYLIHAMGQGGDYEAKEHDSAQTFLRAAEKAGVKRIVYLGGVAPSGKASKHLRSRLKTGELLRAGSIPAIELRAGMIIGAGGLSWQMVRDLSARLPMMLLPQWLQNRSQPVAAADVVVAILRALELPPEVSGAFDLPGPETLTGEEILKRIASLLGIRPYTLRVPLLTPKLSSYWVKLITRADFRVAQELVQGLTSDLLASDDGFWKHLPQHPRTPFDIAAREALDDEAAHLPLRTRLLEYVLQRASRHA